jgi:hypothetical protein
LQRYKKVSKHPNFAAFLLKFGKIFDILQYKGTKQVQFAACFAPVLSVLPPMSRNQPNRGSKANRRIGFSVMSH